MYVYAYEYDTSEHPSVLYASLAGMPEQGGI